MKPTSNESLSNRKEVMNFFNDDTPSKIENLSKLSLSRRMNDTKFAIDIEAPMCSFSNMNVLIPHYIRFIILNNDGKPIYTRVGSDYELNILSPVITTIIGHYQNQMDEINYIESNNQTVAFLNKDPLIFVIITTNYDISVVNKWLQMLYNLLISITTVEKITLMDRREPTKLVEGSEHLFESLLHNLESDITYSLDAIKYLPMEIKTRQIFYDILSQSDTNIIPIQFIMYGDFIVAMHVASNVQFYRNDFYILSNLSKTSQINSNNENWIPICLPTFNNKGYFHCYISRLFGIDKEFEFSGDNSVDGSANNNNIDINDEKETLGQKIKLKYIALSTQFSSFHLIKLTRQKIANLLNEYPLDSINLNYEQYVPSLQISMPSFGIYNYICISTLLDTPQIILCPRIWPYVSGNDRNHLRVISIKYMSLLELSSERPYYVCFVNSKEAVCAYRDHQFKIVTFCNALLDENIVVSRTVKLAEYFNTYYDDIYTRKNDFF